MAQLVAHLLCKQGVTGSSPVGSTTYFLVFSIPRGVPLIMAGPGNVLSAVVPQKNRDEEDDVPQQCRLS